MSLLNVTKVSDTGEQCWGVVLLDDKGATLLRSEKGVRKGEVTSIAKTLKFEGPGAAIVVEGTGKPEGPAWVLEKTDHGWLARFTRVEITAFDLAIKPEAGAAPAEAAEEVLKAVKDCLAHANIQWDPPEADPAYEEKVTDETEIVGIPGSRARLSAAMQEKLNQFVNWKQAQIPVLEAPMLLILDYSPSLEQPPLSIAFDCGCGPKCWMTASKTMKIGEAEPSFNEKYRQFQWEGRRFIPYSIERLPEAIFDDIDALKTTCQSLYRHVVWA